MTVSISRMSIEYYLSTTGNGDKRQRKDLTSYYLDGTTPEGVWLGSGVAALGLAEGDTVTTFQARAVFDELRNPTTGEMLGRAKRKTTTAPEGAKTPAGEAAKKTRESVAGFDLTFSVPKSVSTLWALADPVTQGKIYAAHIEAMKQSIGWLESKVIQTRQGHGGVAHVDVEGIIASGFDHWESRAGDPQLHTHVVVSNRVKRVGDGQWATLDSYTLHRNVVAVSATYNALLFDELARTIGADAELVVEPAQSKFDEERVHVELVGVDEDLVRLFSTRVAAIDAEKDRLIEESIATSGRYPSRKQIARFRQQATLSTRTAKDVDAAVPLAEQMVTWVERARAAGFEPEAITRAALGNEPRILNAEALDAEVIDELAIFTVRQASERRSTFSRPNLVAEAERMLMATRFASDADRFAAVDQVVERATQLCVQITPNRLHVDVEALPPVLRRADGRHILDHSDVDMFTTEQILAQERAVIAMAEDGNGPRIDLDDTMRDTLTNLHSGEHSLAVDQRNAIQHIITTNASLTALIGPAGTGKTTTMSGLREMWETRFGTDSVIGLAPSAAAAAVLAKDLGIPTDNVAKWLYESVGEGAAFRARTIENAEAQLAKAETVLTQHPYSVKARTAAERARRQIAGALLKQASYQLKPNQLVIVDEASMAATVDIAALGHQVREAGAKLVLVGDPAQLDAVDAGGVLGWMERSKHSVALTTVFRFQNAWEQAASLRLRTGDPAVIDMYRARDRIHEGSHDDMLDAVFSAWSTDTLENGLDSVMIAPDNTTVAALNERAQTRMRQLGRARTSTLTPLRDQTQAGAGDTILARKNARAITDETGDFIRNGTLMTVETVTHKYVVARRHDNNSTIMLPTTWCEKNVELGYAMTAHRAQGATVDTAHAVIDESQTRELTYVAMTRGRAENHAYLVTPEPDDDYADPTGMMRQATAATGDEVLRSVLSNYSPDLLAHEEQLRAELSSKDLTRYVSEHEAVTTTLRTADLLEWLTTHYGADMAHRIQTDAELFTTLVKTWSTPQGTPPATPDNDRLIAWVNTNNTPESHTLGVLTTPRTRNELLIRSKRVSGRDLLNSSHKQSHNTQTNPGSCAPTSPTSSSGEHFPTNTTPLPRGETNPTSTTAA